MKRALAILVLSLVPLSAVPQEKVAGCPAGMVCITKADAAVIVQTVNEMGAMLDRAAAMIEERDRALADAKIKSGCS